MTGTRIRRTLALGAGMIALSATLLTGTAQASTSKADISQGSSNSRGVICIQEAINEMHYENSAWYHYVAEDGVFGSDTYGGVRSFQHFQDYHYGASLTIDGIVGPKTGDYVVSWASSWGDDWSTCYNNVPTTF
jgi:peptidoglycan hydrolase-like protein with peptidoglycan-binding domain